VARPLTAPKQSRLRSLRYRALLVVVLVVVLPLAWVWTAGTLETGSIRDLRRSLQEAATAAVGAWSSGADLERVASRYAVRLRVVDPAGEVVADYDHTAPLRMLQPVTDPFYGPGGIPDLRAFDGGLPPVRERTEAQGAEGEVVADCEIMDRGLLLLCAAGVRVADGSVLHVERGSPRLVRSLYEQRFQLSAITLGVLGFGGLLALWIGFRMVRPIEALRDQVVARVRDGVSTEPVVLERGDEVGELAVAFNELLAAIRTRDEANAVFAADLAHELKNPVAAVKAAVEAMATDRPVEGERKERLVRVLGDATARMEVVVQQFLDLARAEAGLPGREREGFDLSAMARALTDGMAADPRWAGVSFAVTGQQVAVHAVAERIETALRNLLSNAAHFAGEGGRVDVAVGVTEGLAWVRVDDTGPGITPEDLPSLFSRYRSTREGGTGLGLVMVKAIAVAHGGRIDVGASAAGGASFGFLIPAAT
jgi:signal transduction histidine kinase